jgi:hypothetical protein
MNFKRVMYILSIPLNVGIVFPIISVMALYLFFGEIRFNEKSITGTADFYSDWEYFMVSMDLTKFIVGYLIPFIVGQILSAFALILILNYVTSKK